MTGEHTSNTEYELRLLRRDFEDLRHDLDAFIRTSALVDARLAKDLSDHIREHRTARDVRHFAGARWWAT